MNSKVTLILVIFLAAIGGYVYFFESQSSDDQVNNTDRQLHDREYGEYDIVELEVMGSQSMAHFARTYETLTQDWKMLQPDPLASDQVDQVLVNGAAARLGRLTASQVITGVADLAQYGLDPPELTVTLTISDGEKIALYTGALTPVNNSRYFRTATDNQTVYLVFGYIVDELHRLLAEPPLAPEPLLTVSPTDMP